MLLVLGGTLLLFVLVGSSVCLYAVVCFRGIKTLCSCHLGSSVCLQPVVGGVVSLAEAL